MKDYSDYLFCFDVDGTLRENGKDSVPESASKALNLLKENGYKIVISSGRGVDSLKRTGLMERYDWDGYICNNGQTILDENGEILYRALMDPKAVIETIKKADELGYAVTLKCNPRIITKEPDEYVLTAQRYFNNILPEVGEYTGQEVEAMNVFGPAGYDYHDFEGIDGINILPGETSYSDFTIKGVTKATAIDFLKKRFNINHSVAFGDSLNDVEMFEYCDITIAMGQGNDHLKQMADYVTTAIDQNGIYNACVHYGFIEGDK